MYNYLQYDCQCYRRKIKAKFINKEKTGHKEQGTETIVKINAFFGVITPEGISRTSSSWVFCIIFSVEIAVESHGGTSGEDHAENDQKKIIAIKE